MKRGHSRLRFISVILSVVIIGVMLVVGCGGGTTPYTTQPGKTEIVFGMSTPLSGGLAQIRASAYEPVYKTWVAEVNAAGGIYVAEYGKRLPIRVIEYDDKSDVNLMTQNLEKLITQDKVDFIFSPCGTAMVLAAAPIANKYGYILTTGEGGATEMESHLKNWPYVFVNLNYSDWYQIPVLADLLASKGVTSAFVAYIGDQFGIEYSNTIKKEFPSRGINVVRYVSLPPEMTDFTQIVRDAQNSNADAFLCMAYPDQNLPVTNTMIALDYNPKLFMTGPGANFGFYHDAFGPAVEGVTCFASWHPEVSPEQAALADKLYKGKPEAIQDWWGHCYYWAGLEFFQQAIEEAGTLNQEKIKDLMAVKTYKTVLGDTRYNTVNDPPSRGLMSKDSQPAQIGQWQNGVIELVGGNVTTSDLIYPKPAWPKS